jgi:hypothetical protein
VLSRPPVPNYIEFTRRQKGKKVEFTHGRAALNALGHAGLELGENGSVMPSLLAYVQEPLPEEMRLLLCLLEGAERRQNLLRQRSSQAPVPMTGDMSLVG